MNLYALPGFIAVVISIAVGIYIYSNNSKDLLHRLFLSYCLLGGFAAGCEVVALHSQTVAYARFWMLLSYMSPLIFAVRLHFVLVFTKSTRVLKTKWFKPVLYTPVVLAYIFAQIPGLSHLTVQQTSVGWKYVESHPVGKLVTVVFVMLMIILPLIATIRFYWSNKSRQKRKQVVFVFWGLLLPVFTETIYQVLRNHFGIIAPINAFSGAIVGLLFFGYAIWRHELFSLSFASTAQNIVATMSEALFLCDTDGKVEVINAAAETLLNAKKEALINKPLGPFMDEPFDTVVTQLDNDNMVTNCELQFIPVGSEQSVPVSLSCTYLKNERGRIEGYIFVVRDISEHKKAREKAIQNAHMAGMSDVAIGILHNLGNLLTDVITTGSCIQQTVAKSKIEGFVRANRMLSENLDRMDDFLRDDPRGKQLMEYYLKLGDNLQTERSNIDEHISRLLTSTYHIKAVIETQQQYVSKQRFTEKKSISQIIDNAITMCSSFIEENHIHVEKKYQDVTPVEVHKIKAMHVLMTILKNAGNAMKQNPEDNRKLTVTVNEDDQCIQASIADNGRGLTKKDLTSVFAFGYTSPKTGDELDLHSCANYMAEMNGRLFAKSDGPEMGAEFILQFSKNSADATCLKQPTI